MLVSYLWCLMGPIFKLNDMLLSILLYIISSYYSQFEGVVVEGLVPSGVVVVLLCPWYLTIPGFH